MSKAGSGPERPNLTAGDIARAAIALVDAEGPARLTMRRLGSALEVEAMALYRYYPSRRALLDALVETVVSDVATDPGLQMVAGDDWQDYLHRLAHGIRQMALTHPRLFPLLATHPTEAPWIRPPIRSVRWVDAAPRNVPTPSTTRTRGHTPPDSLRHTTGFTAVIALRVTWTRDPGHAPDLQEEQLMSALDKAKNALEDIEGKAREALGKATGDKDTQAEGKKDQSKSDLKDAGENVKDAFKH